ncbi:unnamed protein product [Microthlaspi erraticum]|uniref:MADS-box domain-containing protein n=1 Tax=Microthlaspi erraticum TaxID=1685480 RepID=A0A6D2K543_9BRAS|nr:unnamed protein product [Microthlaspi erraticum]
MRRPSLVLYYSRDGELIKTWPEDQSKVRDMAERFSRLSEVEKRKKNINLSLFLNKKMNDDRKKSLEKNDNKFSQKISEMEDSLVKRLQMFQDKLRLLRLNPHDHQTEMCAVSTDHQTDRYPFLKI